MITQATATTNQATWTEAKRADILKLDINVHEAKHRLEHAGDRGRGESVISQRMAEFEQAVSVYVMHSMKTWEQKANVQNFASIEGDVRWKYRTSKALYPDFYYHTFGEEVPV